MSKNSNKGKIYLIPSPLHESAPYVLPEYVQQIIRSLKNFIVEHPKTARHFLKAINPRINFDETNLFILNKHTPPEEAAAFLKTAVSGIDTGLLSEAGAPAVADPGASIVQLAHQQNIQVVPLIGPSSMLLALMASGMNGQNFAFHGYLPIKPGERKKAIRQLEQQSMQQKQTQIFIETPYRNMKLLEDIVSACHPGTALCIAADITAPSEFIQTKNIHEWQKKLPDIHKRPAVFLLYKSL